jgi:hypothetical protein
MDVSLLFDRSKVYSKSFYGFQLSYSKAHTLRKRKVLRPDICAIWLSANNKHSRNWWSFKLRISIMLFFDKFACVSIDPAAEWPLSHDWSLLQWGGAKFNTSVNLFWLWHRYYWCLALQEG